uniref:Uncharacterized protein n=1 Tax=Pseudomonas fragi TaxID=296 RepID=A0A1I9WJL1_PSEFR|nr:hypothetical protein [Pseudomonas fragi]
MFKRPPHLRECWGPFFLGTETNPPLHWYASPPCCGFTRSGPLTRNRKPPPCRYPSRPIMSAVCATCARYPLRLPHWPSASPWTCSRKCWPPRPRCWRRSYWITCRKWLSNRRAV